MSSHRLERSDATATLGTSPQCESPSSPRSSPQSQHSQELEFDVMADGSGSPVGSLDFTVKFDKRRTFRNRNSSESQLDNESHDLEYRFLSRWGSEGPLRTDSASSADVAWEDDDIEEAGLRSRKRSGTWPRTRSLNAPSPIQQFGPCGRIMKNSAMVIQIQDPAFQRLTWYKTPLTVLVIKKTRDISVLDPFVQLTRWLIQEKCMVVHVEAAVLEDSALTDKYDFNTVRDRVQIFREGRDDLTDKIDFIICLGGDGTLLYASSLFQKSVPPIMAFHLGSLGFLTPFLFNNFQDQVNNVLQGNAALTLRSRLKCVLKRRHALEVASATTPLLTNGGSNGHAHTHDEDRPEALSFLVLNEVVVDRGPSPYLSNVDLFIDGKHVTVVQGDGLIVSTPTGSTAYAVAAGASMIHPSVPAIMITPICPHSLSFRPIVVPAGVELKIKISPDSRNTAWVSFDGRNRQEIKHGDVLAVTTSVYPVPSICAQDQIQDWFDSLADCLQWNVRKRQKTFDESEDNSDSFDHSENGTEDSLK